VVKFRYFGWRADNTSQQNICQTNFLRPLFKNTFKNLNSKRKKKKSLLSSDDTSLTYSMHPSDDNQRRHTRLFKRTNLERTNRTKEDDAKIVLTYNAARVDSSAKDSVQQRAFVYTVMNLVFHKKLLHQLGYYCFFLTRTTIL